MRNTFNLHGDLPSDIELDMDVGHFDFWSFYSVLKITKLKKKLPQSNKIFALGILFDTNMVESDLQEEEKNEKTEKFLIRGSTIKLIKNLKIYVA